MVDLLGLVGYCDELLQVHRFSDYCPNGLQLQGRADVRSIVCGVTACQGLIDQAVDMNADAILVHHGIFWKGQEQTLVGMRRQRVKSLLQADISLIAYHLPLDAHEQLGNNVQLAHRLDIEMEGWFGKGADRDIALYGAFKQPLSGEALQQRLCNLLAREPLHICDQSREIQTIGLCTGAAQGYIEQAVNLGLDAYLTGEVSESTVHVARESGIHFFSAGHHATERYGVQALAEHLADQFELEAKFVDIPNPV